MAALCVLQPSGYGCSVTSYAQQRFDHVLVESSGISEPLPVAETFTFRDRATGVALDDVASLANLVTVVDAASVFEQLSTMETLVDRGWEAAKGDERTVSHLLCDQLEFADLLLLNKRDLVTEERSARSRHSCARPTRRPRACRHGALQHEEGRGAPAVAGRGARARDGVDTGPILEFHAGTEEFQDLVAHY